MTVQVEEIEGDEVEVMLAAGDSFAQRLIVRKAGFVEYD
ncbi:hypothetical protein X730_29870 [Mesorhizobium sp. L103C565B0]|nr:hypothetical protein X730_29870 [Mesorhizobium sp. L103C565B0]